MGLPQCLQTFKGPQAAVGREASKHRLPLTSGNTKLALGDRLLALLALGPPGGGALDVICGVLFVRHGDGCFVMLGARGYDDS